MDRHTKLARTTSHMAQRKEVSGKGRKRKLSRGEVAAAGTAGAGTGEEEEGGQGKGAVQTGKQYKWKKERKR